MVIHHVCLFVNNFSKSKGFYTPLMHLLDHRVDYELPEYIGYAKGSFGIARNTKDHTNFAHLAFAGESRSQVDMFYKKALELGGKCNGAPGLRAHYGPTYYAAFVYDFDGNNIEICHIGDHNE